MDLKMFNTKKGYFKFHLVILCVYLAFITGKIHNSSCPLCRFKGLISELKMGEGENFLFKYTTSNVLSDLYGCNGFLSDFIFKRSTLGMG